LANRLTNDHYFDFERVSSPQISPDGARIVYTRQHANKIEDRWDSSLWMMNADGSQPAFLPKAPTRAVIGRQAPAKAADRPNHAPSIDEEVRRGRHPRETAALPRVKTRATHALSKGFGVERVQDWIGHANIQSTMEYAKVTNARRNDMAQQLKEARLAQIARILPRAGSLGLDERLRTSQDSQLGKTGLRSFGFFLARAKLEPGQAKDGSQRAELQTAQTALWRIKTATAGCIIRNREPKWELRSGG